MALRARVRRKTHRKLHPILGDTKVKVGLVAGEADSDNIDKALWNHFGTETIPERPFLTNAMRNNTAAYRNAMRMVAEKILRGETTLAIVLAKLGLKAADDVKAEITALSDPPNAASTVTQKGSSNPLIDTGEMRNSVTWKIDE
ncbi:hypothetical protein JET14_13275 [Martelella lutilitoris]|uniref:Uncharacterized protein n=1 Tax=Martelella lutilitoris TaxID=2583532 RepID=A0A7T7KK82_9HYPH|nr:hypothetical protein [Martelella lutilitoris]QQM29298.1 hypothetical protein JET14_13275 [Martelella lutilitoris]